MAFVTKKYRLISRVQDRRQFNIDNLEHYSLLLQLGEDNFQVCVTDTRNGSCLLLEDYEITSSSISETAECLRKIIEEHNYLMANFWKSVTFSVKNEKFTFVPSEYFSENNLFDYLKFNAELNIEEENSLFIDVPELGAVTVFAVNNEIKLLLDSIYIKVNCKLIHQSCSFVSAIIKDSDSMDQKRLLINIDRNHSQFAVFNKGKLLYYNQFKIKNPSELIRYVMTISSGLGIDLQTGIVVWSSVADDALYINELKKYVQKVQHGKRPSYLRFSFEFDEVPTHQYLDVYGIHLLA